MKSWGIIIVTALGFLMGLILAGVGVTSAKTYFSSGAAPEKRVDSYWRDADLGSGHLFELLSNANCHSSEKYFLACANSVIQILPKYHFVLSLETGKLIRMDLASSYDGSSERDNLQPFLKLYQKRQNRILDFESLWAQLLDAEQNKDTQSYIVGQGINAFLSVYKDPHSYILPNEFFEQVGSKSERSNLFVGLSFERNAGQLQVRKVFRRSDADQAGLKEQDQLLKFNGKDARYLNLADISFELRNAERKHFELQVKRGNDLIDITIKRSYRVLNHIFVDRESAQRDYAVLTLAKFNRGVCAEVSKHIKDFSQDFVSGMILDLRDNPGGELNEAACIAGLFIGMNKKIYSVKYFDPLKSEEVALTTGSLLYTGPLVILVNSSSASAAELLAGALQEYNRAVVVGERTFGKGTFQEPEVWHKNPKISLFRTQGLYLLPSGASTQLLGIKPDFEALEGHVQLREESNYLNPIQPRNLVIRSQTSAKPFEDELKKCASPKITAEDVILKKGLEVLSCHRISSLMASQFGTDEFNQ